MDLLTVFFLGVDMRRGSSRFNGGEGRLTFVISDNAEGGGGMEEVDEEEEEVIQ